MVARVSGLFGLLSVIGAGVLPAGDLDEIRARGAVRVVVHPLIQSEVFTVQESVVAGFEGEMVQAFASLNRLKVEVVNVPDPASRIQALVTGKADLAVA